jgi:hypothetical protein
MLTLGFRLTLLGLILAFLAACDPRTEEEPFFPPAQEISPEEIIKAVLEAEKSIDSIRIDTTAIKEQRGHREESTDFEIRVGQDHYSKTVTRGPSFRETACDFASPEECAEQLAYCDEWMDCDEPSIHEWEASTTEANSMTGTRTAALWERPAGSEIFGYLEGEDAGNTSESEYFFSELYGFSFERSSLRLVGRELSDAHPTIRLSGQVWFPEDTGLSEMEAKLREGIDLTGESAPQNGEVFESIPDRFSGSVDLWIDPETFLVYQYGEHLRRTPRGPFCIFGTQEVSILPLQRSHPPRPAARAIAAGSPFFLLPPSSFLRARFLHKLVKLRHGLKRRHPIHLHRRQLFAQPIVRR